MWNSKAGKTVGENKQNHNTALFTIVVRPTNMSADFVPDIYVTMSQNHRSGTARTMISDSEQRTNKNPLCNVFFVILLVQYQITSHNLG